jgi:hypothetical protein
VRMIDGHRAIAYRAILVGTRSDPLAFANECRHPTPSRVVAGFGRQVVPA